MNYGLSEILELANKEKDRDKKIEILRKFVSVPLLDIFRLVYDNYEWDLTKASYNYRPSNFLDGQAILMQQIKKIPQYYLKGSSPHIPIEKKELLWVQMLETVDPADAKLIESVRRGKMPYRTLTKNLIEEAFPGIFNTKEEDVQDDQTSDQNA